MSQLPAIFLQQAISASVMLGVGKHASKGAMPISMAKAMISKRRIITTKFTTARERRKGGQILVNAVIVHVGTGTKLSG
jgi:hypothetical protein